MKNFVSAFLVAGVAVLCGCTTVGNGVAQEKIFTGEAIRAIKVSGPWKVNVVANAKENRCIVSADENIWPDIKLKSRTDFSAKVGNRIQPVNAPTITIHTTGNLNSIELESGAVATVTDNSPALCNVEVEDDSQLTMSGKSIDVLNAELDKTAHFTFNGRIGRVNLEAEDASEFKATKVVNGYVKLEDSAAAMFDDVEDLEVKLEDRAKLEMSALSGVLRGKAKDTSTVTYGGAGHILLKKADTVRVDKK